MPNEDLEGQRLKKKCAKPSNFVWVLYKKRHFFLVIKEKYILLYKLMEVLSFYQLVGLCRRLFFMSFSFQLVW